MNIWWFIVAPPPLQNTQYYKSISTCMKKYDIFLMMESFH